MDRVAIGTYMSYHWLAPEIRAQVEAITINWEVELDDDELERFQAVIEKIKLKRALVERLNITCEWCGFDHFSHDCLFKRYNLLNLVAEKIQGELPSATMKHQEEEENTLSLEIGGQLGEVESIPAETKQEDVSKEEEERAQVSIEVFNAESPLVKFDFNEYFLVDMVDEILQENTYKDPLKIYLIQAKEPIKEYVNCLNTSSSYLESKGAILEELGRRICWPKPKPPQNSMWRKSYGGFNLRAKKPRFQKTREHALRPDPKPPWSGRKSS
ncbi:hypothetical protein SLEP1_g3994 [Rubroshorea leprosula]|uniref:Uncharacterized protein n=1 Tax=Rubroshorea leprosula TaxID=152421 RepID=A0AAV5HT10_9ROSI|nr:hypothetical protein SLEP1_g3994 [Rubroshorea leprosula]